MEQTISFRLNNRSVRVTTDGDRPLLWVLRDNLGLTGTKFGCGTGECGACSVLIDGEARRSCRIPVAFVSAGQEIVTIEGLGTVGNLSPLQQAFVDYNAFGCGFCTPGMIITATALLARNPNPTRAEIIEAMDHNLCRCSVYTNIIEAIQSVVEMTGGGRVHP